MIQATARAAVHLGDGASMHQLADGDADLVLTSPPYFPSTLEPALRRPFRAQHDVDAVERQVVTYALSLQPIFSEIARALSPAGKLVIQTRDLRYGGYLIGPADTHRRLAEATGFHLMAEISWQSIHRSLVRDRVTRALWRRGQFVTYDVEKFLVMTRASLVSGAPARPLDPPGAFADPQWRTSTQGARRTHPFESPMPVLRRLIELYSEPGDLVVDPFCGHGTTLVAAISLGRDAVGWDIDPDCVANTLRRLGRATEASTESPTP